MKKPLLISFIVIIISIFLGLFLYSSYQYRSLNERYVQLVPGIEDRIVIVDVGDADRSDIAKKINQIAGCSPAVIGVDLFFKDFDRESPQDSMLLQSIQDSNCVLGAPNKGLGIHNVHKNFQKAALGVGFAELNQKEGYASDFYVYWDTPIRRDYHFAYVLANQYDSLAVKSYLNSLTGNNPDLLISRLTSQFKVFDSDEPLDCNLITDRIVIVGSLEPDDQFKTYARYHDDVDDDGPDMFGAIIIANQILMILDYVIQ